MSLGKKLNDGLFVNNSQTVRNLKTQEHPKPCRTVPDTRTVRGSLADYLRIMDQQEQRGPKIASNQKSDCWAIKSKPIATKFNHMVTKTIGELPLGDHRPI
jgi:hypothetical protein